MGDSAMDRVINSIYETLDAHVVAGLTDRLGVALERKDWGGVAEVHRDLIELRSELNTR